MEIGFDSAVDLVDLMLESRVNSSFPQVYKALFPFATFPVTVANAERSLSKRKLIKIYLRSAMAQKDYMMYQFSPWKIRKQGQSIKCS